MRGRCGSLTVLLFLLVLAVPAQAQGPVDACRELAQTAAFSEAMLCLDGAAARDDLDRQAVLDLLAWRAYAHFAIANAVSADVTADIVQLAALSTTYEVPVEFPSALVDAYRARAASARSLEVTTHAERRGERVVVPAEVRGDTPGLVREVRVHARARGAEWASGTGRLTLEEPGEVEYYAEVVVIGGAVAATDGTAADPRVLGATLEPEEDGGPSAWLWIGIGGGVALLVIAAVVIGVVASSSGQGDDTEVLGPTFGW